MREVNGGVLRGGEEQMQIVYIYIPAAILNTEHICISVYVLQNSCWPAECILSWYCVSVKDDFSSFFIKTQTCTLS